MKLDYSSREIFWGNEALIVADMAKGSGDTIDFTNLKIVTGLVSVGAMEDQAETANFPADDVPDHGVKKGATLLQGEMVFIQTDQALKEDMLGQQRTANGLGWSPTGNWKTKCVQYLIKGRKRDKTTGEFIDGWRVVIYPNLTPTAEATKESETDSVDGVDPIQWTLAVQATDSDIYLNAGRKVPAIEYEIWGDQAKDFASKMEAGLFIMQPDTVLAGGIVVPEAPTGVTGKFETNGDITLTYQGHATDKAFVIHYGDANQTAEKDLVNMGYSETTTWTLPSAKVPALQTGDTINLHVQAFDRVGVGATDELKAKYLNENSSITGSAWSEPAVQLTKA